MKLMMLLELGSTGELEMSWFQALSAGKGTNPLRLAPRPRLIAEQDWVWAAVEKRQSRREARIDRMSTSVWETKTKAAQLEQTITVPAEGLHQKDRKVLA